ncbi:hypothetical protein GQR58_030669 [Nymphon striatum]|nr:hypothetical protein GQR58_030669 [Nymphon striatum]
MRVGEELADALILSAIEGGWAHERIDEVAVALVGRHATRTRVRLVEETFVFERTNLAFRSVVELERGDERLLGHIDATDRLHALLAFFLFLQELVLTRDVTAVQLGGHVFAERLDGLASNEVATNSSLNWHVELLARDELLELLSHAAAIFVAAIAVHNCTEGIDVFTLQQDVDLDQVALGVAVGFVVEAGVALGAALHLVEEVDDDLGQGQPVDQFDSFGRQVFHAVHDAATALAQLHERAGVGRGRDDRCLQERLLDAGDLGCGRHVAGIIDEHLVAVHLVNAVLHRRSGSDQAEVELAFEALSHDLHMQKAELLHGLAQRRVVIAVDWVKPAEHHGIRFAITIENVLGRIARIGDRLARAGFADIFDASDEIADLSGVEHLDRFVVGSSHADLVDRMNTSRLHEAHRLFGFDATVHDPQGADHTPVLIEVRVKDQGLKRRVWVADRRRDAFDDRVENGFDAFAGFGAARQNLFGWDAQDLFDFAGVLLGLRSRKVNLVEHPNHFEVVLECQICRGERLRLDALSCIDQQHDALAGGQ